MKIGDLVRHRVIHGLGTGLVIRLASIREAVYVLWPKHQDLGPVIENIVSLELLSEAR